MAELSPKQDMFCREYLIDLNATQAAIRAGYSAKTANVKGAQLLAIVSIQNRIAELLEKRTKQVSADAAYVLRRLVEIDQMDVADILRPDMSFKPIPEWPDTWRRYITSVDLAEVYEGAGDERELAGILKKIKWPDKLKNLELLGKHVDVQAFREQVKTDHTVEKLSDLMDELTGES